MFDKSALALALLAAISTVISAPAAAQPASTQAAQQAARSYAQALVDQTIAAHPDLIEVDVHAVHRVARKARSLPPRAVAASATNPTPTI